MLKRLVGLMLCFSLNACWFLYLPSGSLGTTYCVPETAKVGTSVRLSDGRLGTVSRVLGRSERCQDGLLPLLVDLEFAGA